MVLRPAAMTRSSSRSSARRSTRPTRWAWLRLLASGLATTTLFACGGQTEDTTLPQPADDSARAATESESQRPNIVLLLADDLGYSDLGFMGSEISTPNLDALAARGKLLSHFYVGPTCSPSRAMLLTGNDSHKAGFGTMNGLTSPEQEGQPGYETHLSPNVVTVASVLQDAGYHTYMAGKWHLGVRPGPDLQNLSSADPDFVAAWRASMPEARGFERAHYILQGGSSHFDNGGITGDVPVTDFLEDGAPTQIPAGSYSSEFYTDKLIEYIDSNRGDGKPFFAFASYTAPHWPLHAPDEFIGKYEGVYDVGYEEIRRQRIEKMKRLGLLDDAVTPHPGEETWAKWNGLTDGQRAIESKRMQVYAAMVEALDFNIGRLIAHLEAAGELDNTFLFFLADNGPDGNNALDLPETRQWVRETYDNSIENMGRRGSFLVQGPGWAQVSAAPFRMYKGFVSEGGISTPAIAAYGDRYSPAASGQLATLLDFVPTVLDLADATHPGTAEPGGALHAPQGRSMRPYFEDEAEAIHEPDAVFALELFNRRALRQGDWKLLWLNAPWGVDQWELFNVKEDPAETQDLFAERPEVAEQLLALWDNYRQENGVILMETFEIGYTNGTSYFNEF